MITNLNEFNEFLKSKKPTPEQEKKPVNEESDNSEDEEFNEFENELNKILAIGRK